ncbi:MAG TPA: NAD-dependent succinate-semialdehyde dehydrogenase [Thermomicrobiales bacterium]|nr:NAD-dependent succinate-semialdehyde dehydrogenase [Thermomicrobiales bacterium]
MVFRSINPATEEVLATYEPTPPDQVDAALAAARDAYGHWRERSFAERAALMRRAAEVLRAGKARYGGLITAEMGKTIGEAEAEVEKCALNCDFYAARAQQFLADEHVASAARESFVAFEPLGVVLAIMPWNFPFWQVFRFAAPALMAGNTAVLKHASNVSGCALAIEEVFREAGFPKGVFRTLLLESRDVDKLIEDPRIAAVTLTGSDAAGSQVAGKAGQMLKKTVLELGGSDPFIVLDDADLAAAADVAARARYQNAGQSCIAAKRFIVVESVADEFAVRLKAAAEAIPVGDPTDRATRMGPLARADLLDALERQLAASVQRGAKVIAGGERLPRRGYFFPPTIVTDVTERMPVFREETFGPLAAVIRVPDTHAAIATANDSQFGLGGNLWTRDVERGKALARQIESGSVFINGMTASNPLLPFGGVKRSGYGRELSSFGIREFTNVQTIWVEQG